VSPAPPASGAPDDLASVTPLGARRRDVGELQQEVKRLNEALQVAEQRRRTAEQTLAGMARMAAADTADLRIRLQQAEGARDAALAQPRGTTPAAPPPARPSTRRRLLRGALTLALVAGALLIVDGVLTIVWQEPITALQASRSQATLRGDLRSLDASFAQAQRTERQAPAATGAPHEDAGALIARQARVLLHARHSGQALGRISIPRIGLKEVFVEATDHDALEKGPGHYRGTVLPGMTGTVGLAGHRTTYLAPFRRVNELRKGSRIVLHMPYGIFTYAVSGSQITTPANASALRSHTGGHKLVLTACHPLYSAAKRIVVTAQLVRTVPV
jgi:sortase A